MSLLTFQRLSLTEIAYEEIKKSICLGEFGPGYKLVIDDLVKTYEISNTPIKEALNRLAAEGLVESLPRRGMQVRKITLEEIKEIHDMRIMYETYCAKKAIKKIDNREDIKKVLLDNLNDYEEMLKNISSYDYAFQLRHDEEFHLAMISLSENNTLEKEYKRLKAVNMAFNNYAFCEMPSKRCNETLVEHRNIYQSLINKNLDLLLEGIEIHIENVMSDMLRYFHNEK